MRRRAAGLLLLSLLLLPLLAGCWDRRELEEQAFVLLMGVDKGEKSAYNVTVALAIPSKMAGSEGGGGGKEDKPYLLTSVEAPTITGALDRINSYINRLVSLHLLEALLIGEDVAREDGFTLLDEFVRFRQARRSVFYIVTKGKAKEFLDRMEPKIEPDPHRFISQMTYNTRVTGMMPAESQIHSVITSVDSWNETAVTYYAALTEGQQNGEDEGPKAEDGYKAGEFPREGGPNMELLGSAVFRKQKMVGVLTDTETRLVNILRNSFNRGFYSLQDPESPDEYISVQLHPGRRTAVQVDLPPRDPPHIRVEVRLEAELAADHSEKDYTEPHRQRELEERIAKQLKQRMKELLTKTQEWGTDVAGFGETAARQFATVDAWEAYDWAKRYPDAKIDVDVQVVLRRFGLQLTPPGAKE